MNRPEFPRALACAPLALALALFLAPLAGTAAAGSPVFPVDNLFYPWYPSLVKWEKSTAGFTAPSACADCHEDKFMEWTGSVHALAFRDPVYQGELNKGFKAVGHEVTRQCEGCHSPAGMVTGEIRGPGLAGLGEVALAGVSCDVCHSVSAVTHWQTPAREPENGSLVLAPGVDGPSGPVLVKRAPAKPSDGCGEGFHECVESPLHASSDLCASCHQVYHYDRHFPIESTYLEWKHGPYAQKDIHCQDCHMVETDVFLLTADDFRKPERGEYRHYFNGANYLLSFLAAEAEKKAGNGAQAERLMKQYDMAVARLKAAARLDVSPVYRDGRLAEVAVRVANLRAGHNLPTSLTNVREMWIEITARDGEGKVLLASGTAGADGRLPSDARVFNSEGMGNDFHFAVDPWVVTAFARHDTIPPRGYRVVHYGVPALPAPSGAVSVEARLRYRQADQKLAEALLAAVPKDMDLKEIYGLSSVPPLPVVDMAEWRGSFPAAQPR